jgi:carboxylesterase
MVAMPVSESARPLHTDGTGGVLFLHGFTGSPRSLRPWAERRGTA